MTEPQAPRTMKLLQESRSTWSSGRILGGSSAINALMYMRGHPEDYDEWAELVSGETEEDWTFQDAILPLFKRSQELLVPDSDDKYVL